MEFCDDFSSILWFLSFFFLYYEIYEQMLWELGQVGDWYMAHFHSLFS